MAANNLTTTARPHIIGAWVDPHTSADTNNEKMKQRFKNLSSFIEKWEFFTTPEKFYNYLDDNPKTHIFLILSGQMGQIIVPAKHGYCNIHSIYIFCGNVIEHRRLKDEFDKVKDVMNLEDLVYERIADELSLFLLNIGESYLNANDKGLAQHNIQEALRLMRDILHMHDKHGRVRQANDLLERLVQWNIT